MTTLKLINTCFAILCALASAQERNLTRGSTKVGQMEISSAKEPVKVELRGIRIRFLRHGSEQEPGSVWVVYDPASRLFW